MARDAVLRDGPYVWLTWLSRWIGGDRSCDWSVWFQANNFYDKLDDGKDWTLTRVKHTRLLKETRDALIADGYRVRVEDQNKFTARHEDSPSVAIGGKPDLLAFRDDDAIIIDVKTGLHYVGHDQQVLLPMALMPRCRREYEDVRFRGQLIYEDGSIFEFHPQAAEDLYNELPYFLNKLSGPEDKTLRAPSARECAWCPISSAYCPDRIERDGPAPNADPFG